MDADRPSFERALFRDALQADATDAERARAFAAATAAIHDSAGPLFQVLAQAGQTDRTCDGGGLRSRTQTRTGTRDGSSLRAPPGSALDRLVDVIYALSSTSPERVRQSGLGSQGVPDWLTDELTRLLETR